LGRAEPIVSGVVVAQIVPDTEPEGRGPRWAGVERPIARVRVEEAELLSVARALVERGSYAAIQPTLAARVEIETLGPTAMRVLKDILAKGVVRTLACLGGARRRRAAGTTAEPARVFDVRAAPRIAFGPYAFELLRWLAAWPLGDRAAAPFVAVPRAVGDEMLAYLAMRLVSGQRLEAGVAAQPGVRASALAWLGFARALTAHTPEAERDRLAPPSFDTLLSTVDGRVIVECLEGDLRERWTRSASWPRRAPLDPAEALRLAEAERATALGFLGSLARSSASGAWDLATFFVEAGSRLLRRGRRIEDIVAQATPPMVREGPLRVRAEARRASGAPFHALVRLGQKREELALLRFFEDGYEEGQVLLATWDALGKDGFARAADVARALSSLDPEVPS
jgi:hypothetical protein